MFGSTMMLTVGQAIDRAHTQGQPIRLLVGGTWMTGQVTATDAQSVMLLDEAGTTCIVRTDAVTAVMLLAGAGERPDVPTQPIDSRL